VAGFRKPAIFMSYKIIEHTADIGIEVGGSSIKELFINAADGLVNLIVDHALTLHQALQGYPL